MAITASVALSNSTPKAGQKFTCTLTVNNSAGAAVNVIGIDPLLYPTGALATDGQSASAIGVPFTGPGSTLAIPASGALTFTWDLIVFVPQGGYWAQGGASEVWVAGAIVSTSDGGATTATTANATVGNFP